MFLIGTPIFLLLYFIAEDLFSFVFGQSWALAGIYTKIVLPFFYIRFISSALSSILSIYEKQKMEFFINFIILSSGLLLIFFSIDFLHYLKLYNAIMSLNYLLFLTYYYKLSINKYETNS